MTIEPSQGPSGPDHSLVRPLLGGVVAAAIALGCIMPPLVHIVTGPLGPAIGGFVVSQRLKPDSRGLALIAGMLGLTLASVLGGAAALVASRYGDGSLPDWFPTMGQIGAIAGGVFVYGTGLGAIGAGFGARSRRASTDEPSTQASA